MALKVVNLSKRYKDKWVLRDITFDVAAGEIFGICGSGGAGKTSLLATLSGVRPNNGGACLIDGKEVSTGVRRRWLHYSPMHVDSLWRRVFSNSAKIATENRIRHFSDQMSAADAVALLDDPFLGLDGQARSKAREVIADGRDRGLAIILAATDFEHVMSVADRAAILAGTEIKQTGTPEDLYENPGSRAVASVTGRCNFLEGRRLSSSKAEIPEFLTIDGGHRLFAKSIERGSLGAINQNVTLGIRPEHISISFGASFPEDNLLRATITGVQFLGPTTLVELDCDGLKLESLVLRLVGLNIGDECVVGLPPERVHIFRS